MDSYDEVHDVKNGHDIATPPESLENIEKGTSSGANVIQFTKSEDEEEEEVRKEKQTVVKVPSLEVIKGNFSLPLKIIFWVFCYSLEATKGMKFK